MKKIITLLVLFFAFSMNAQAQDRTVIIERNAKNDLHALIQIVPLENDMQINMLNLFKKKHNELTSPNISEAAKKEMSSVIEAKIRATLDSKQMEALEKNAAVFKQLISAAPGSK